MAEPVGLNANSNSDADPNAYFDRYSEPDTNCDT